MTAQQVLEPGKVFRTQPVRIEAVEASNSRPMAEEETRRYQAARPEETRKQKAQVVGKEVGK